MDFAMRWRIKQETSVGSKDEFSGFQVPQEQNLVLSGDTPTLLPAELIAYTPLNLTMPEYKNDQINAEQLKRNVARLLAALSLDEERSSSAGQELTICIKWYMGGLDIVLEDGSSQIKDVLLTYVVTLDNMVRFIGDLKRIQTFLDDPQSWRLPMKLTVKYVLHQGVNRYDCMLVAPVVADQFSDQSTTKSNTTIPTTVHVSVPNEEDSVMTSHDLITPGLGNQPDELGTVRSSVDADVSLESQQFSNKTTPTGQVMTIGRPTALSMLTAERADVSSISHPMMERALVSTSQGLGASSRQPVEIDENSIMTTLAGDRTEDTPEEQETLLHPTYSAGSSNLLTQLLEPQGPPRVHRRRIWQATGDPHSSRQSSRSAKNLVWISWCLVLIALGYHGVMSFFFSSAKASSGDGGGGGDSPNKDDRRAQVLDCAKILSNRRGLAEKDENVTAQWQAVHWFSTAGIHIEVPDEEPACVWKSSFGRLYGLIVARETLGISDLSWHRTNPPLSGFEDVCRWKRITCDPDKQFVERLILNHADLMGSIPMELAYGLQEQLVDLHMENNDLTGTIPSELGQLTQLETLFLHENALTGTIPSWLGQLSLLKQLQLHSNKLVGSMPSEICELRKQHDLAYLHADCRRGGVTCDTPSCCTACK
jgi:Leucine-rich repeat (LRR) protein